MKCILRHLHTFYQKGKSYTWQHIEVIKSKLHTINKTWEHMMVAVVNTLPKHARKTIDHSQINYLHAFSNYLANTRGKNEKATCTVVLILEKLQQLQYVLTSVLHKFHKILILIAPFIIFTSQTSIKQFKSRTQ